VNNRRPNRTHSRQDPAECRKSGTASIRSTRPTRTPRRRCTPRQVHLALPLIARTGPATGLVYRFVLQRITTRATLVQEHAAHLAGRFHAGLLAAVPGHALACARRALRVRGATQLRLQLGQAFRCFRVTPESGGALVVAHATRETSVPTAGIASAVAPAVGRAGIAVIVDPVAKVVRARMHARVIVRAVTTLLRVASRHLAGDRSAGPAVTVPVRIHIDDDRRVAALLDLLRVEVSGVRARVETSGAIATRANTPLASRARGVVRTTSNEKTNYGHRCSTRSHVHLRLGKRGGSALKGGEAQGMVSRSPGQSVNLPSQIHGPRMGNS